MINDCDAIIRGVINDDRNFECEKQQSQVEVEVQAKKSKLTTGLQ